MTGATDDDFAVRLAALTPEQRARFEALLAERAPAEDTFPLAVLQRGTWFLEQLRPRNPGYVVPGAVRVEGPLDSGLLRVAVAEVVRRHEALRTTFELRDGAPVQVVHRHVAVDVPETDLTGPGHTEADRQKWIDDALAEPFDIDTAPLVRVRLLRTGPEQSVIVMGMHHLISDRWSSEVFLAELSELYEASIAGRPAVLPELTVQYGDFASWQHQQLEDGGWQRDLAYWRDHLAGAPPVLELPADRPRPAVQGFNGGSVPIDLPPALVRELAALAARHGATPYMALLAVFHILLHRLTGQDDIVVGVPTALRGRAEVEPLIGYFVNTLPIRGDLSGNPTAETVLTRVRDACLGAYEHQDVPFELIVADLNTPRDLSRPPVYQVSFSYGREPVPTLAMAGAHLTRLQVRSEGARFELELQAFDTDGGLTGWFEFDRDLFDRATIVRLATRFRRLVEQVTAAPRTAIGDLDLLDAAEHHRVVTEWNATEREFTGGLVHECIEAQARRTPGAEAVRLEGACLGYAELNERANRLAHLLRGRGVGRDVLVGVAMERSLDLVVALLAVLKAGGAYVPLDPDLPPARLAAIAEDARPPVVLTHGPAAGRLPALDCPVLRTEDLAAELAEQSPQNPGVAVDGEDLAYVIFTSGSTGRPKGVLNVHAALRNRLLWMQDAHGLDASDRVLQKTPFSFDVSVWEFFWPLMAGATLVMARPGGHRDSGYLADTIAAERITTVHFVPSMLRLFLTEPPERSAGLRRVFCSGEELPRDLHDGFLALHRAELHNLYGPTEAAIDVTAWHCSPGGEPGPVPIGRPIANLRTYVLDRHDRPVPVGVAGELCIGGRGLARGYLRRPDLTAECFAADPFLPGARIYRTGDLARHRADGALEFLGRLDHQVKLRGQRLELGEIEAVLCRHGTVREAIVTAREHAPGDVRLAAYVTAAGPDAPAAAELAAHLREYLPDYMVPASLTVLEALPLTPSGKADRKALPEPASERPESGTRFVAPEDGLEHMLADMWRGLLGVERVGTQDNFFDLGGHSLLMAELRAGLASLGHELTMVELFQHPTVGSLASYLGGARTGRETAAHGARQRAENRRQSRNRRQQAAERRASSRGDR
ncbi:amino acid adenylation domain-containing protein [Streptomyces cocklensis]|uniref:Amino acid adenylation domain-containing protein n=1 Tax=Actinacidiphila cocklensis TaxID=887465 RepID=A0A9W4DW37_9ACTN|nr:amino acid adenylation domain-containing protein [Actinacidiphila cocklensis]MDD1059817.1 amino acid adenylation domain-containing protein [Actinacidiphila cocklensis]WSX72683.1 amino acid adenylation domain-containing protein [Streptomyces sp. NBC_00899]WSX81249.1 amino acid adenylation domain-containing protein [Streptomyces sp. NBC_00899]CAG6397095.1 Amino acid adenylation domain-containing protein [Actinacidiphila cocklensis]